MPRPRQLCLAGYQLVEAYPKKWAASYFCRGQSTWGFPASLGQSRPALDPLLKTQGSKHRNSLTHLYSQWVYY